MSAHMATANSMTQGRQQLTSSCSSYPYSSTISSHLSSICHPSIDSPSESSSGPHLVQVSGVDRTPLGVPANVAHAIGPCERSIETSSLDQGKSTNKNKEPSQNGGLTEEEQ